MTFIRIGNRTYQTSANVPLRIPAQVRKVRAIVEKLPDGKLLSTAQVCALAGYSRRTDGLIRHPDLQPFVFQYSYRLYLWGNRKEIAYVKKAAKQSGTV